MSIFSGLANAINNLNEGFNEGFNSANQKIEKLKVRYEEMLEYDNDDCFIKRSVILDEINKLKQLRDKELSEYNAKSFAKFNLGQ